MAVFQPNGLVLDTINTVVTSDGSIVTSMASYVDAKGDGTGWVNGRRASMIPSFAGLIRTGEISSGRIPHALAALAPNSLLKTAAVWPAAAFDRSSNYAGILPMGTLLAIPSTVDIGKLGLSPQGLVIARAAQDFGVYLVDRGGGGLSFLAELGDPEIRGTAPQPLRPGGAISKLSRPAEVGRKQFREHAWWRGSSPCAARAGVFKLTGLRLTTAERF